MAAEVRVVYSPLHSLHRPRHEFVRGRLVAAGEVPARAEEIRRALEAAGHPFQEPTEHGEGPIHAVHDPAMVRYLEVAWRDWRSATTAPEAFPDTVPHSAMREGMGPAPEPDTPFGRIGFWCFDTATPIGEGSYAAARAAVDVALTAADLVLEGEPAAYGLCRPPGHHAARAVFGGFCLLNNAAVAAEHLVRRTGDRVAVLDLDYHHGNGTQQIFYERPDVLYVSLHGDPRRAYPFFTGYPDERGTGAGEGATVNLPLESGCSDDGYLRHLDRALDRLSGFPAPIVVVSLGFDTHGDDPITDLALTTPVYEEIGRRVAATGRRLVVLQEGGYHLPVLGECARLFVQGLEGEQART